MYSYIPHTEEETALMLKAVGLASEDELFSDVRAAGCLLPGGLNLPEGLSEQEVLDRIRALADRNTKGICFLGAGCYDHIIPSAVRALSSLPAFTTAYTPYQPEISQGLLEAIFEYQSMICALTGMDVSNASLYDGATAAVEAAALALSDRRKTSEIVVSGTVHPFTLMCLNTWAHGTSRVVKVLPEKDRVSDLCALDGMLNPRTAVFIAQSPNRYGVFEDFTGVAETVHAKGALFAVSSDPMSLAIQKSQAQWGADIAIGDAQSLGLSMGFGGPSCGYMAVRKELMRRIPGRIVGQTADDRGNRAYVLTLQAREQHIKRERATSNICSNEALCCITSVIYTSLLGWEGLKEAAVLSYDKAHYLCTGLRSLGYTIPVADGRFWCEFPVVFPSEKKMEHFIASMRKKGIFPGVRLGRLTGKPADAPVLLVAVTEKRTREELDLYLSLAKKEAR